MATTSINGLLLELGNNRETIKDKLVEMGLPVAEPGKFADVANAAAAITVDAETTEIKLGQATQSVTLEPGKYYKNEVTVGVNVANPYMTSPVVPNDETQTMGAPGDSFMTSFQVAPVPTEEKTVGVDDIVTVCDTITEDGVDPREGQETTFEVEATDGKYFKKVTVDKVFIAPVDFSENEEFYSEFYNGSADPMTINHVEDKNVAMSSVVIPRPKVTEAFTHTQDILSMGNVDAEINIPAGFYTSPGKVTVELAELYNAIAAL